MWIENQNTKANRIKVGVKKFNDVQILGFSKQEACVIEARKEVLKTKKMWYRPREMSFYVFYEIHEIKR